MNEAIIAYLSGLQQNNNREWYYTHKEEYQNAQKEFEGLIQALILAIGSFDAAILLHNPKELTFKLTRDTRFSHDKSPYNPAFRCHIAAAGKLPVPVGYYLSIRPDERSFLGGGLFADMFKDATRRVRDAIFQNQEAFLSIVNEPAFREAFQVRGTSLKNVPKEYPADCPAAEYLKYKSWYVEYPFPASQLTDSKQFVAFAAEKYRTMKPFNDFLNRALAGFTMPER